MLPLQPTPSFGDLSGLDKPLTPGPSARPDSCGPSARPDSYGPSARDSYGPSAADLKTNADIAISGLCAKFFNSRIPPKRTAS